MFKLALSAVMAEVLGVMGGIFVALDAPWLAAVSWIVCVGMVYIFAQCLDLAFTSRSPLHD